MTPTELQKLHQAILHAAQANAHQAHQTAVFAWIAAAAICSVVVFGLAAASLPYLAQWAVDIWDWIVRLLTWNWERYDEARCERLAVELLDTPISQWQAEAIWAMNQPKRGEEGYGFHASPFPAGGLNRASAASPMCFGEKGHSCPNCQLGESLEKMNRKYGQAAATPTYTITEFGSAKPIPPSRDPGKKEWA